MRPGHGCEDGMLDVALAAAALCLLIAFSAYLFVLSASATRSQQALSEALRNVARVVQRSHAPISALTARQDAAETFSLMGVPATGLAAQVGMVSSCASERIQLQVHIRLLPGLVLHTATTQPLSLTGACA